jgi:hypothetical protein
VSATSSGSKTAGGAGVTSTITGGSGTTVAEGGNGWTLAARTTYGSGAVGGAGNSGLSGVIILRYPNTYTATVGGGGGSNGPYADGSDNYLYLIGGTSATVTFS